MYKSTTQGMFKLYITSWTFTLTTPFASPSSEARFSDELGFTFSTSHQGSNFIAAIAVEGEQNAVDHCGNDGNFLPYSAIFILFTVHYYFDT